MNKADAFSGNVSWGFGIAVGGYIPSRLRHLIVYLSQRRCHLIRQRTSNNHNIRLPWRSTENDTKAILIVAGGGKVHHLDGAASKAEGHGPERGLSGPVGDLVEGGSIRQSCE